MVKLRLLRIATECVIVSSLYSVAIAQQPTECCSLVAKAIEAAARLKPNMTRSDIENDFRADGGLHVTGETVYVYKSCPDIKIRVTFVVEAGQKASLEERPGDVVLVVSQPYLEYPHYD